MTTSDGGREPGPPGDEFDDLTVQPADPPPVTDEMITPRTSPSRSGAEPGGDDTPCRVCGERNQAGATYCLGCGVRLGEAEPEPWVDDDESFAFDHDAGLVDLGEVDPDAAEAPETQPDEAESVVPPRDTARLIRRIVTGVLFAAAVFLLFITFRPPSEPEVTTTTTSVDAAALAAYKEEIAALADTVAQLENDATDINATWEERSTDYETTLAALSSLSSRAAALPDLVQALTPPEAIDMATHLRLITSASTVADAAAEMVEGLEAPDTGEARRAALTKFAAAAVEFGSLSRVVFQTADAQSTTTTG